MFSKFVSLLICIVSSFAVSTVYLRCQVYILSIIIIRNKFADATLYMNTNQNAEYYDPNWEFHNRAKKKLLRQNLWPKSNKGPGVWRSGWQLAAVTNVCWGQASSQMGNHPGSLRRILVHI